MHHFQRYCLFLSQFCFMGFCCSLSLKLCMFQPHHVKFYSLLCKNCNSWCQQDFIMYQVIDHRLGFFCLSTVGKSNPFQSVEFSLIVSRNRKICYLREVWGKLRAKLMERLLLFAGVLDVLPILCHEVVNFLLELRAYHNLLQQRYNLVEKALLLTLTDI